MAAKKAVKVEQFWATGRRKKAIARVRLIPGGKGEMTINKVKVDEYFAGNEILKTIAKQPLTLVDAEAKYNVFVNVYGGGLAGQAGAIRHGVARALVLANEGYKVEIKAAGFLARDPRMKERKKYGLKKARKAPQFSKR